MANHQHHPDPQSGSAEDMAVFIANMPKAELHVHLEGCITPELASTLATRNNMPPPPGLAHLDKASGAFAFHDLSSFLAIYGKSGSLRRHVSGLTDGTRRGLQPTNPLSLPFTACPHLLSYTDLCTSKSRPLL